MKDALARIRTLSDPLAYPNGSSSRGVVLERIHALAKEALGEEEPLPTRTPFEEAIERLRDAKVECGLARDRLRRAADEAEEILEAFDFADEDVENAIRAIEQVTHHAIDRMSEYA